MLEGKVERAAPLRLLCKVPCFSLGSKTICVGILRDFPRSPQVGAGIIQTGQRMLPSISS